MFICVQRCLGIFLLIQKKDENANKNMLYLMLEKEKRLG